MLPSSTVAIIQGALQASASPICPTCAATLRVTVVLDANSGVRLFSASAAARRVRALQAAPPPLSLLASFTAAAPAAALAALSSAAAAANSTFNAGAAAYMVAAGFSGATVAPGAPLFAAAATAPLQARLALLYVCLLAFFPFIFVCTARWWGGFFPRSAAATLKAVLRAGEAARLPRAFVAWLVHALRIPAFAALSASPPSLNAPGGGCDYAAAVFCSALLTPWLLLAWVWAAACNGERAEGRSAAAVSPSKSPQLTAASAAAASTPPSPQQNNMMLDTTEARWRHVVAAFPCQAVTLGGGKSASVWVAVTRFGVQVIALEGGATTPPQLRVRDSFATSEVTVIPAAVQWPGWVTLRVNSGGAPSVHPFILDKKGEQGLREALRLLLAAGSRGIARVEA